MSSRAFLIKRGILCDVCSVWWIFSWQTQIWFNDPSAPKTQSRPLTNSFNSVNQRKQTEESKWPPAPFCFRDSVQTVGVLLMLLLLLPPYHPPHPPVCVCLCVWAVTNLCHNELLTADIYVCWCASLVWNTKRVTNSNMGTWHVRWNVILHASVWRTKRAEVNPKSNMRQKGLFCKLTSVLCTSKISCKKTKPKKFKTC